MRLLLVPFAAALLLSACGGRPSDPGPAPDDVVIPFREDGTLSFHQDDRTVLEIAIEIADTDSSRMRGLMQRQGLPERSGMLFVFPREEMQSFWMANTPLSLDLLFLDAQGRIVSITKYARPLSTDPVLSRLPAQYVVEMEAGFVDSWGIVEGDSASWRRSDAPAGS